MENKYPVLKCNKELWNEIKPVLESFDIYLNEVNKFSFNDNTYLASNFNSSDDELYICAIYNNEFCNNSLRYLVNTKEEFLSAVAKLLGKEYPIKELSSEIKYPYIICTQQLYNRIKDILKIVGYEEDNITDFNGAEIFLIINYKGKFGHISNVNINYTTSYNRYQCNTVEEFLIAACELQGFKVSYINNAEDNDSKNHYFGYCANNETKTIGIYENEEEGGLQTIVVEKSVVPKKKFKKKKERYVVSYDPAIDKDSTVVATIPAKGNDFDKDKKDMEKINIAKKLKHCKKGTKLYSPLFGEVEFNNIYNDKIFIITCNTSEIDFCKDGRFSDTYPNAECLLFPSKDNRDWDNFQVLEKGHRVMVSDDCIDWRLREFIGENYASPINGHGTNNWNFIVPVEDFDFAAEDITTNKEKSIV